MSATPPTPPGMPLTGVRVLVVDDERLVLSVVARMLTRAGAEAIMANDADEAERVFHAASRPFDLVLTDILMPGRDGLSLARALRERRPDLRVVFMTAWSENVESEPLSGPLLMKPFTWDTLLETISQAVGARDARTV